MSKKIRIAAFGALNQGSYDMFRACIAREASENNLDIEVVSAGPYPNAQAVSAPGRPLRGEALKDPARREELITAVADDARALGDDFDVLCMPCMSMIGFHDGVEQALGTPIVKLADALTDFYKDKDKLSVIHMRPAKQRVQEMFGDRAITPDAAQAEALLKAEEQAKHDGNPGAVEAVMKDIAEGWRDQGHKHVLFARADAPMATKSAAGQVSGIEINSYFDLLAKKITSEALS